MPNIKMLKSPKRLSLLLFSFLCCLAASGQLNNKDVETSVDALNKAMISQDKAVLEKLTADELSYGHSTGLIENKSEFEKNILTGPDKFSTIENTNQHIQIADNFAIVRCISAIKGTAKGGPLDLKIGLLMIWVKRSDGWKLLARQGYKLPQ
jgi:ketosteroid isomerase-like protein